MKVKDLPEGASLVGVKVKIPKKYEDSYMGIKGSMYLYSWWQKGVWLKKSMEDGRIYPLTLNESTKEVLDFEIDKKGGKRATL